MQQTDSGVEGTNLELWIIKGYPKILAINSKSHCPLVHIDKDTQDSVSLKGLAIVRTILVGVVSELAYSKEGPAILIIAESCFLVSEDLT